MENTVIPLFKKQLFAGIKNTLYYHDDDLKFQNNKTGSGISASVVLQLFQT